MNEALLAIVLGLAWFTAMNAGTSVVAAGLGRAYDRRSLATPGPPGTGVPLALVLLPGGVSLVFTLLMFAPAHWRHEPPETDESAGYCLAILAAAGGALLIATLGRTLLDAWATRNIERRWRHDADAGFITRCRVPVYHVPDSGPVMSLVGVRQPRLYISRPVIDALTPEELDVSVAHELAHRAGHDNVKRLLVACAPDMFVWNRAGSRAIRRWRAALEFAADARAAAGDERRALALASALLKVARLAPVCHLRPAAAWSQLYDGTMLAARVGRLLDGPVQQPRPLGRTSVWLGPVGLVLALAALMWPLPQIWFGVHTVTEGLLRLLP